MPRTIHVEHCMGTVFSIDIRDEGRWQSEVDEVVALLHHVDRVFSTYRDDSDVNRLRRGELRLAHAHPDVRTVLELCADAQEATSGAFSAMRGGRLDPTGLVKGWAIEQAVLLLRRHGVRNVAFNGGGDVVVHGAPEPGRAWGVGIVDPRDRTRVLETVTAHDLAVATSGTAERGSHIIDPATCRPAAGLLSATVVGPSMTLADAYATAAFVMGPSALRWIAGLAGYEALVITDDGTVLRSSAWGELTSADTGTVTAA